MSEYDVYALQGSKLFERLLVLVLHSVVCTHVKVNYSQIIFRKLPPPDFVANWAMLDPASVPTGLAFGGGMLQHLQAYCGLLLVVLDRQCKMLKSAGRFARLETECPTMSSHTVFLRHKESDQKLSTRSCA